jgi:hypothetical protein
LLAHPCGILAARAFSGPDLLTALNTDVTRKIHALTTAEI